MDCQQPSQQSAPDPNTASKQRILKSPGGPVRTRGVGKILSGGTLRPLFVGRHQTPAAGGGWIPQRDPECRRKLPAEAERECQAGRIPGVLRAAITLRS